MRGEGRGVMGNARGGERSEFVVAHHTFAF